jgi:hypothetical protein
MKEKAFEDTKSPDSLLFGSRTWTKGFIGVATRENEDTTASQDRLLTRKDYVCGSVCENSGT